MNNRSIIGVQNTVSLLTYLNYNIILISNEKPRKFELPSNFYFVLIFIKVL